VIGYINQGAAAMPSNGTIRSRVTPQTPVDGPRRGRARRRFPPRIGFGPHQSNFIGNTVDLVLGFFNGCHRFADAAPGVIKLAEVRIGRPR
jgi:hypothetical protein